MEYRDYYATLGVPRDASQTDIRKAFRKLARAHHPDVNRGDDAAERRFKEVSEANEVLSDPAKRTAYDALGRDWQAYQRAGGASGGPFPGGRGSAGGFPGGVRFEVHGDTHDLSGFSDFFRTFFTSGGGTGEGTAGPAASGLDLDALLRGAGSPTDPGRPRATPRRGATAEAEIDLAEVESGTERRVRVGDRTLEVRIPPGVEDRQRIRLSGTSEDGGHVTLTVRVRPHPVFVRSGSDLTRELPLTLGEALLGAEVRVPALSGRTLLLRIPAGTQNGRLFRLSGQGLPRFRAEGRGDLLVRAKVVLPDHLDETGVQLARELVEHVAQPDPRTSARDAVHARAASTAS